MRIMYNKCLLHLGHGEGGGESRSVFVLAQGGPVHGVDVKINVKLQSAVNSFSLMVIKMNSSTAVIRSKGEVVKVILLPSIATFASYC